MRTFHWVVAQANAYMNAALAVAVAKAGEEDAGGADRAVHRRAQWQDRGRGTHARRQVIVADCDLDACIKARQDVRLRRPSPPGMGTAQSPDRWVRRRRREPREELTVRTVQNWIGGRAHEASGALLGRRVRPGDRRGAGARGAGGARGGGRRGGGRRRRVPAWAAHHAARPRARDVPLPRADRAHAKRPRGASSPPSMARCSRDAGGEVTRGLEVVEFACGIPHLLKGEFTEQVGRGIDSYSLRQPLGVVRRHHAVQFPGDGAAVDVAGRDRLRQHLHPQAVRARSLRLAAARRTAARGRAARRRLQRRAGRQGGGRRDAGASGHRGGELRRLDPDRRVHLPDRHARTASACRRWAAQRTTWW